MKNYTIETVPKLQFLEQAQLCFNLIFHKQLAFAGDAEFAVN